MAHAFCYFTDSVSGNQAKSYEYCYVGGKIETQKGCEMQTICAIMKEIRAVTGMGRFMAFQNR